GLSCFVVLGGLRQIFRRLGLAIEQHFYEPAPERAQHHPAGICIRQNNGTNIVFRQEQDVALKSEQAPTVGYNRRTPATIDLQAHSVATIGTNLNVWLTAGQQISLGDKCLAIGELTLRELDLNIPDQVVSRRPDAACRTMRIY